MGRNGIAQQASDPGLVPLLLVTGFAANAAVLAAFHLGWPAAAPIGLRLVAAIFCLSLAPGAVGLALFYRFAGVPRRDAITELLYAFIIGFSLNLLVNVLLYAANVSLADVLVYYLPAQLILSGCLIHAVGRRGPWLPRPSRRGAGIVVAIGLAAVAYATYQHGYPLTNNEELIALQKLATNPSVRFDNLAVLPGQPTTYFFVPYQVLIAGVSILAGFEPSFTQSLFWPFSTAVAVLATVKLAEIVTEDRLAVVAVAAVILIVGLFEPRSFVEHAGVFTPYPNRYGIASGMLLPLVLWLFWDQISRRSIDYLGAFSLIYVTMEMTFVHAGETLIALACFLITGLVMGLSPAPMRREMKTTLGVVATMIVLLLSYKVFSIAASVQLDIYLESMKAALRDALAARFADGNFLRALFGPATDTIHIAIGAGDRTMAVGVPTYEEIVVRSWSSGGYAGRIFVPFAMLFLPVYAWVARSRLQLACTACLTLIVLAMKIPALVLLLSYLIGNPEVFLLYNIVFLLSLVIFTHGLSLVGEWLVFLTDRCGAGRFIILSTVLLFMVVGAVWFSTFELRRFHLAVNLLASHWTPVAGFLLHLVTLAILVYRARTPAPESFPPAIPGEARRPVPVGFAVGAMLVAFAIPVFVGTKAWKQSPFSVPYPPGSFAGDFDADYDRLVASGKLLSRLPKDVIAFLRTGVRANRIVIGGETNTVLMTTNHFAPVDTAIGQPVAPINVANWMFLERFAEKDFVFDLRRLVSASGPNEKLLRILEYYRCDLLLVLPKEHDHFKNAWSSNTVLQKTFTPVFDSGGHAVYAISKANRASH